MKPCRPHIVTISGSGHSAGKTALAARLAAGFPGCGAVKVRPEEDLRPETIEETDPVENPDKDTGRALAAGARKAWLVQGPLDYCRKAVQELMDGRGCETLLVETNALVGELAPDLAFYVRGPGKPKPGAAEAEARADVVVLSDSFTD